MVQPHRRAVLVGGVNWVNSLAPIGVFIPFSRQLDGSVLWQFLAEPLSECVLQRSEDFLEWSNVATNSASSLGRFEFREADVKSVPQRFYRLRKYP